MGVSTPTAATAGKPQGWLFGAAADLWLGCGLAYLAMAIIHYAMGEALIDWVPAGLLILVFSMPHYGATLLRTYEAADDRVKYRLFALHGTVALVLCLAVGSHVPLLGSLLLTIYLTWSPWHYTGQNYGVGLMLLARRGIQVDTLTKRVIHISFIASFAMTFFAIHGASPGASYAPVNYDGALYQMLPLGIPSGVASVLLSAAALVWAGSLVLALVRLLQAGGGSAVAPFAVVLATQAMWFSVPVLLRLSSTVESVPGSGSPFSSYGFVWVAAAHAAQYLWITTYFGTAGTERGRLEFLGLAALAGFAVWTIPGLIFAPGLLGGVAYDSGLALLVASVVNLHHFILDGAIWKLRDGAVARVLLRPVPERDEAEPGLPSAWPRRALIAVGSVSIAVAVFGFWQSEFGYHRPLAKGQIEVAEQALEKFAWIGRDGAVKRNQIGRLYGKKKEHERAKVQLARSLSVEPTFEAHFWLGSVHEREENWEAANEEYSSVLDMEPDSMPTRERRARVLLELDKPESAIRDIEAILAADPFSERAKQILVRARIASRR